jgi:PKHD-type hydroxylase
MYPISKFRRVFPQFCIISDVFSNEEIDMIVDLEDLQKFQKGQVGSGKDGASEVNIKSRDSSVMWITPDQSSDWIYHRIADLIPKVNYDFFMQDIEAFTFFQYTVYRKGEYYDWHIDAEDVYNTLTRKMSIVVSLTDPNSYDGGEFEIIIGGNVNAPTVLKPKKGDVIIFNSWMPHRVRPVVDGVRKSLVTWISGKWH